MDTGNSGLSFDQYQKAASKYDTFDNSKADGTANDPSIIEKVLGLAGEAGETADKFKKIIRDKDGKILLTDKVEIMKEMGDVMWYLAAIADYLGVSLSEVAQSNIDKLQSRYERNKIHGAGDNR